MARQEGSPRSLVTGAAGFLGVHLCEVLAEAGHRVVALDTPEALAGDDPRRGRFPSALRAAKLEQVAARLGEGQGGEGLFEGLVDYVFHAAGEEDPDAGYQALRERNVAATEEVIRLAIRADARRLIHLSSGRLYGSAVGRPFREDMALDPRDDALLTRALAEKQVLACGRAGVLDWIILRPGELYGPRAPRRGTDVYSLASLPVLGAPSNLRARRPFVHVRDVAGAALHLATHEPAAQQVFNVADRAQVSRGEWLRLVAELSGRPYLELPPAPLGLLAQAGRAARGLSRLLRARAPSLLPPAEVPAGLRSLRARLERLEQDLQLDTSRLEATGFTLRFPHPRAGVTDTLGWYRERGWLDG